MQLEQLVLCCQVIFVIRRPNVDESLVRLMVEGDIPHLRTSGFDCRETKVTDQQRNHKSAASWRPAEHLE